MVGPWNSLPERVVSAPSVLSFEKPLDQFWTNLNLKFDFRKSLDIDHSNNTPVRVGTDNDRDNTEDLLEHFNADLP